LSILSLESLISALEEEIDEMMEKDDFCSLEKINEKLNGFF